MNKEFSINDVSKKAWDYFYQDYKSWILLVFGVVFFGAIDLFLVFFVQEYIHLIRFFIAILGSIYTAIMNQNGLDAVYGRPLTMIHISPEIVYVGLLFIPTFLYILFPFPSLEFILAQNFYYSFIINYIFYFTIFYFWFRGMFFGMIMLEQKLNIMEAVKLSFKMTQDRMLMIMGIFLYIGIILILSACTIVGYFIVLPYTILLKALLYKNISENLN